MDEIAIVLQSVCWDSGIHEKIVWFIFSTYYSN